MQCPTGCQSKYQLISKINYLKGEKANTMDFKSPSQGFVQPIPSETEGTEELQLSLANSACPNRSFKSMNF